jgi:hypothetical protein
MNQPMDIKLSVDTDFLYKKEDLWRTLKVNMINLCNNKIIFQTDEFAEDQHPRVIEISNEVLKGCNNFNLRITTIDNDDPAVGMLLNKIILEGIIKGS